MKNLRILWLAIALFTVACSDDGENKDPDNQGDVGALINGTEFTPDETNVTSTGSGLEIKLAVDENDYIILRLNGDAEGTYPVLDTSPGGRIKMEEIAYVECVADGEIYYGVDGEVILVENTDGTVSGEFDFTAENEDGDVATITEGIFENIEVGEPPAGVCRITNAEWVEEQGSGYNASLGYDGNGNLVYLVGEEGDDVDETFISYNSQGKPVKVVIAGEEYREESTMVYGSNGLVSEITSIEYYDGDESESNYTYSYDANGRITSISTTYEGEECTNEITYSGDNIYQVDYCYEEYSILTNYDTKNNPGLLFLQALASQPALVYYLIDETWLSTNNPGESEDFYGGDSYTETYTYQYNSANYPTQITETDEEYTTVLTLTYAGCN